jgi:uncharacterized membrane protein
MFTTQNTLLFLSTLLCALITGLLYGYACSVNPGLNKLPDLCYLKSMQSVNKEIQNPVFFCSFFGTVLMLPLTTWYAFHHASAASFYLILSASILYLVGVLGVTVFGNIPLNETLGLLNINSANPGELSHQRGLFEVAWNRYHILRTVCSFISLICTIAAIIKYNAK